MDQNKQVNTLQVDEEKEITEAKIAEATQYYLTPKFKMWEGYFYDKKNKETFGNSTMSACRAYGLDPTDKKAYNVGANVGYKNIKKSKNLRKRYWEAQGLTPGKLLDLYNNLMIERKDVNLLYSIAEDMHIDLPEYKTIINAKQGMIQQNNTQITIEGGVTLDQLTDDQLKQYIESKRFALRSTSVAGSGETNQTESTQVHPLAQEAVLIDK